MLATTVHIRKRNTNTIKLLLKTKIKLKITDWVENHLKALSFPKKRVKP